MEKVFTEVAHKGGKSAEHDGARVNGEGPKKFPKGVVLGKDGKPWVPCGPEQPILLYADTPLM